jgi:uroporphyrinogen-III synthase
MNLIGRRILVTRPKGRDAALIAQLQRLGAEPVALGALEYAPPQDWSMVDATIDKIDQFDWVVFTSVKGVQQFLARVYVLNAQPHKFVGRLAAVGNSSAIALLQGWHRPVWTPAESNADSLGLTLPVQAGQKVLLAQATEPATNLAECLAGRGALVETVSVYQLRYLQPEPRVIQQARTADAALFFSPSSVNASFKALGNSLLKIPAVCMGKTSARAARNLGISEIHIASETSLESVLQTLAAIQPRPTVV